MLRGDRTSIKTQALCSIWRDRTNTESFVLLNCLVLTEVGRSLGRKMKSSEKALWGGWGIRFSQPEVREGTGRGQSLGCTEGLGWGEQGVTEWQLCELNRRAVTEISQCNVVSRGMIWQEQSGALNLVLHFCPGWIRQVSHQSWRVRLRGCWNDSRYEAVEWTLLK